MNKENIVFVSCLLKVCHSSAFETILFRSVYIKIINYNDSILASLNNTMQTKQHAIKNTENSCVVDNIWAENVQYLQFLLTQ